jgi:hypothetical protein
MLKSYEKGQALQVEKSGYLASLQVGKNSEICFVSGDEDIYTMEELINRFGYDAKSLINQRIVFSIENEERETNEIKNKQ